MDRMVALVYPHSGTDSPRKSDRRITARVPFDLSKPFQESIVEEITAPLSGSEIELGTIRIASPKQALGATFTRGIEHGIGTMVPEVGLTLARLYQQLAEFSELDEDWDSYGARSITPSALTVARGFLESITRLMPASIGRQVLSVWIAPLPNGGVLLEWRGSKAELEVEATADGKLDLLLEKLIDDRSEYAERSGVSVEEVVPLLHAVLAA